VNPWSRADDVEDEETWRALFERRARAMAPGRLPALDAVLRAADARDRRRAHLRTALGALLVAAGFVAAAAGLPRTGARVTIRAEWPGEAAALDARARGVSTWTASDDEEASCDEEHACESAEAIASSCDPLACFLPESTDLLPASTSPHVLCGSEMSCAIAPP
jgi:hypothetical protein